MSRDLYELRVTVISGEVVPGGGKGQRLDKRGVFANEKGLM